MIQVVTRLKASMKPPLSTLQKDRRKPPRSLPAQSLQSTPGLPSHRPITRICAMQSGNPTSGRWASSSSARWLVVPNKGSHREQWPIYICTFPLRQPSACKDHDKHTWIRSSKASAPEAHQTSPSYSDSADTMVSSRLLPSLNSAISNEPFSSLSIILKIFFTLFSGVSSSAGSLTMEPT